MTQVYNDLGERDGIQLKQILAVGLSRNFLTWELYVPGAKALNFRA